MRYNAEIQKAADAYAKKHGYFCAVYIGPTDQHKRREAKKNNANGIMIQKSISILPDLLPRRGEA